MPALTRFLALLCLSHVLVGPVAASAETEPYVPDPLDPWVEWVLHGHEQQLCPVLGGSAVCLWPGILEVEAEADEGAFRMEIEADRELFAELPGSVQLWPQEVLLDGRAAPVVDRNGRPAVEVSAGRHRIAGVLPWHEIPETIPVPPHTALVSLSIRGTEIASPRVEDAVLWLQAGEGVESEEDRFDMEVFRRVDDGVPLMVTTRIELRVAGKAREVNLGKPLLDGTVPVGLTSAIPARLDEDGQLVAQVISGTWTVEVTARTKVPPDFLAAPQRQSPWPEVETWVFSADERLRTVNLAGAPGVDPARTALPDQWRTLPAYLMAGGTQLTFEEIRRGEPDPPPDQLTLHRVLWLDGDGHGLTVRDQFSGQMHEGWRIAMVDPGELGHAATYAGDVLITTGDDGLAGVELRESSVQLEADSRIAHRSGALPAVGWDHDVQGLGATLNLPPGWVLLTATGVDELPGTWAELWSLLDLFFLLIIVLTTAKLAGWRWGAVALVAVGLAFQATGAPTYVWLALLAALALQHVLGTGKLRIPVLVLRWLTALVVVLWLLPFLVGEVRHSLFPSTEEAYSWSSYGYGDTTAGLKALGYVDADAVYEETFGSEVGEDLSRSINKAAQQSVDSPSWDHRADTKISLANQQNPLEIVQTGPGIPTWSWRTWPLVWSGPVSADHEIRLFLAGPLSVGLVRIGRVLLMILLAIRLALGGDWRKRLRLGGGRASSAPSKVAAATATTALIVLVTAMPARAGGEKQSVPAGDPAAYLPAGSLEELQRRMLQPPSCRPQCVSAAEVYLSVSGNSMRIVAEVHAAADAAWSVPGPAATWVPESVRVDGSPTAAVVRMADGFLHVRLDQGVHEVVVEGPLPASDSLALQFGLVPHRVAFRGDDWVIDGLREDGTVGSSVQLARLLEAGRSGTDGGGISGTLPPWLEVTRELAIGMPWQVETTVRRVGPSSAPVLLRVPLLDGESVNDESVRVEKGEALVSMGRDDQAVRWSSTLEESDALNLTAPQDVPWTEVWSIVASPIWSFDAAGIPPVEHTRGSQWWPTWRPWPGESLAISFTRPAGVEGQTVTIDRAELRVLPGIRMTSSTLDFTVRTSRGGKLPLTLPDGAKLQSATIDGQPYPVKPEERQVVIPLEPGSQNVVLQWQRETGLSMRLVAPEVELGAAAVNAKVVLELPHNRWIVAAMGPGRGPAVLWWVHVAWILLAALLLGRTRSTPLKTWHWFLLGLGMTQIPVVLPLLVVGWLLLLGYRRARPPKHPVWFNRLQVAVVGSTLVALIVLYASVHAGLLLHPDMQIAGFESWDTTLTWYVDRIDGTMPQPSVLSLPLWIWRILMLLWALWMAASLVIWLRWGWESFTTDGLVKKLDFDGKPAAEKPAGTDTGTDADADGDHHSAGTPSDSCFCI